MRWPWWVWMFLLVGPLFTGGVFAYGVAHRRALRAPLGIFLGLAALSLLIDLAQFWTSLVGRNNWWLSHLWWTSFPPATIYACSWWAGERTSRFLRGLAFVWLAGWLLLFALGAQELTATTRYSNPANSLLLILVSLTILWQRTFGSEPVVPFGQPWFWVCTGVLCYATITVLQGPVMHALIAADQARALVLLWVSRIGYLLYVTMVLAAFRVEVGQRGAGGPMLTPAPTT